MDVEITPEPTPAEREALQLALGRMLADEGEGATKNPGASAWWRAGVWENVETDL